MGSRRATGGDRIAAWGAVEEKRGQTACKPGSVPRRAPEGQRGDGHSSGTPVAGRLARPTRTATRKPAWPEGAPSLCGLAPGGVCRAGRVAAAAVRSYRTLSPLPAVAGAEAPAARAVCFLWHFPWGHPRRVLPGTVFPWSPDFPPPPPAEAGAGAAIRPSDTTKVWILVLGVNGLGRHLTKTRPSRLRCAPHLRTR